MKRIFIAALLVAASTWVLNQPALVAFKLPDSVDSRAFRDLLLKEYGIVIKVVEKRWFNGNRISPHIFNTENDIDAAKRAVRTELA